MKQAKGTLLNFLRLLALAASCTVPTAYADAYSDANQLLQDNKLTEALTLIDSQLADKPTDPRMRLLKGVVFRAQGKHDEAIAVFAKLTNDFPEVPEPYNNLAVVYASQGQYDKARAALETAIRNNPGYAIAHENLGDIYAKLASQAYAKALAMDTGNGRLQPKLTAIESILQPTSPVPSVAR